MVLAFLAGLGIACARDNSGKSSDAVDSARQINNPTDEVMCYLQPDTRVAFTDSRWSKSPELENWAWTERSLLDYIRGGGRDFERVNLIIDAARKAYFSAQSAVTQGILLKDTYDLAGKVMSEWHRDLALSYTSVECYEQSMIMPEIADASQRLSELTSLHLQGKITFEVVAQARKGMEENLVEQKVKPEVAKELPEFLTQLLGF